MKQIKKCVGIELIQPILYIPEQKIIGTTPDDNTDIPLFDDPSDGHGTAVTGAVIDANPDAIIFLCRGSVGSSSSKSGDWLT